MQVKHVRCGPYATESEIQTVEYCKARLGQMTGPGIWILLSNLSFTPRNSRLPSEIDLVAIGPTGLYVLEIKHWNLQYIDDPMNQCKVTYEADKLQRKANIIATTLRSIPTTPSTLGFVQGKFVLSRPDDSNYESSTSHVKGLPIHRKADLEPILHLSRTSTLTNTQIEQIAVSLEPKIKTALDLDLATFESYSELQRISPLSDRFRREYRAVNRNDRANVILYLYDYSALDVNDPDTIARREFETIRKLQKSDWIPRIVESFQDALEYPGELFFFSLQDSTAPSLATRNQDITWSFDERLQAAAYITNALCELQKTEDGNPSEVVAFRNLSPHNIRVRANGKPIFFDLRFTKLAGLRTVANAPGFSNVTDYWIAPEVIAKGIHAAGTDADTFAICASLERIFLNQADSRTQAVRTVLAAGIEPTPHKRPTISTINQRLQSLLTKKISRNRPKLPDARYWDEDLEIPFRGNLYKVVARLGQGGFGSTFKVVQINEQKREEVGYFVAKAIHDPNIGPAALEAYTKARAHAIHSNLAAILEVSNHWQPNQMAVLMSWIHGVTMLDLAGRLRQHAESVQESSTESLVLLWIRQLCDGLQRLHKAGFIHGDITPTNIIVSGRDVRLTDYDLVTRIGVGAIAKSTPAYCSPVMDAQDKVTPADDLFSLAASFFHVLFARLPFEQNGTTRKEKGLNWSNLDVSQAKVVSEFFGRATAPALADRFDSIDQALQFLSDRELSSRIEQQLLGHPEKSADPHTAVTSTVELETGASCAIEATSRWENAANALNNLLMAYMNKQRLEYAKLLSIYIVDFCGKHLSSAHPAVQQSKSIFDQLQAEGGHAVNSESGPKDRFSELFKHLNELTHEFLDASDWSTYDELIDLQLQVRERAIGYKSHTFVDKLRKIADQYIEFARYEKAEPLINRALKIRAETHKGQGTAIAGLLDRLTCIYVRQRKYPEAESIGRRLLKIRKQSNDTEGLGKTWHTLGLLYSSQDNCDKALHAFEQSLRLRKQSRSSHNQRAIAELMLDYAKLLRRVNQEKRATQMERLAEGLMRKKLPDAT